MHFRPIVLLAMWIVTISPAFALAGGLTDLMPVAGRISYASSITESGRIDGGWEELDPPYGVGSFVSWRGVAIDIPFYLAPYRPLNDSGQAVGNGPSTSSPGQVHALLYDNGVTTDLGTLGGPNSEALGITASGDVVGNADVDAYDSHPFLYSGGTMLDLGTLGGNYVGASVFNNAGRVAGESETMGNAAIHLFVYADGQMTDIGTFGIGRAELEDMNEAGVIIGSGTVTVPEYTRHAFRYDGSYTDLGTFGGNISIATDINDAGQIVGYSNYSINGSYHAFLYDNGTMSDLGTLGGAVSLAYAINEHGQIVGMSQIPDGSYHAFLYSSGVMHDLGTLGGAQSGASDVNDDGLVVGSANTPDGNAHSFILACPPLPQPSCNLGIRSSLQIIDDADDAKDRMTWRWSNGSGVTQEDLGDPSSDTTYTLCLYDSSGATDHLAAALRIDPSARWTDLAPKGWSFADEERGEDGVDKASLRTGEDGRAKARIIARGSMLPMPNPVSLSKFLDIDDRVVVQMTGDATEACWESRFTSAAKNDGLQFKARSK